MMRIPKIKAPAGSKGVNFSVILEGDKELLRAFNNMREASAKKIMRRAIMRGLTPMQREARAIVDIPAIGRLIRKKAVVSKTAVNGQIYVKEDRKRTIMLEGREVDFSVAANILEFGSEKQNIKARRFMRGAREAVGTAAVAQVKREAAAELEKAWAEADRKGRLL